MKKILFTLTMIIISGIIIYFLCKGKPKEIQNRIITIGIGLSIGNILYYLLK